MSLQDPTSKMSKSDESDAGCVMMLDDPTAVMKKFKRAVTDSDTGPDAVRYDRVEKPGVANLLEINAAVTGRTPQAVADVYEQYGRLKVDTGEAVLAVLEPIRARYHELIGDRPNSPACSRSAPARPAWWPRPRSTGRTPTSACCRPDRPELLTPTDRRIVSLAIPALGTLAVEPLYRLADTAIVGQLGTEQLGGLAIAASILSLVVAGSNFLTYGTTERVARRLGAGRPDELPPPTSECRRCGSRCSSASLPHRCCSSGHARWRRRFGASGDVLDFMPRRTSRSPPSACRSSSSRSPRRAYCGGHPTTRTPLWVLLGIERRQPRDRAGARVRASTWASPGPPWSTVIAQVGAGH